MLSKSKTQPVPLGTVIYQDDPAVAKFDVGKRDEQSEAQPSREKC